MSHAVAAVRGALANVFGLEDLPAGGDRLPAARGEVLAGDVKLDSGLKVLVRRIELREVTTRDELVDGALPAGQLRGR